MVQTQTESMEKIQINLDSPVFGELVNEAIDETFANLGLKVKLAFFHFLEDHYKLGKEDIPARIGDFVTALEKIFGASASLVEIDIVKILQQRVPSFTYLLESSDLSLEAYLRSLRQHVENLE